MWVLEFLFIIMPNNKFDHRLTSRCKQLDLEVQRSHNTKKRVCSLIEVRKSEVVFSNCLFFISILTLCSSSLQSVDAHFHEKLIESCLLMDGKMCSVEAVKVRLFASVLLHTTWL